MVETACDTVDPRAVFVRDQGKCWRCWRDVNPYDAWTVAHVDDDVHLVHAVCPEPQSPTG
jgi:hypothetical protein